MTNVPEGHYRPTDDAIVCENGRRFYNRPLYLPGRRAIVLAGDRPALKLAHLPSEVGCFMLMVRRGKVTRWLHDLPQVTAVFQPNQVAWHVRDKAWPGFEVTVEAAPFAEGVGCAVRLRATGMAPGDALGWCYGGAREGEDENLFWTLDPNEHPDRVTAAFDAAWCAGNEVRAVPDGCDFFPPSPKDRVVRVRCDRPGSGQVTAAEHWPRPGRLRGSRTEHGQPLFAASVEVSNGAAVHWSIGCGGPELASPASVYAQAVAAAETARRRVVVRTPDVHLDRAIDHAVAALEAQYEAPLFLHGAMSWNAPYLGWRGRYGATVFGGAARLTEEARQVLASQSTDDNAAGFVADPQRQLTLQAPTSRFYGSGHLKAFTAFYNMQEVYFDQLIHAWRWSGDPELEALLRPALERHLEWERVCFDPDGDGVYESYLNVWASDSVWYGGGGTAQASAYAFAGHRAAAALARRAGDERSAAHHDGHAEHIRAGTLASLWSPERGHLAEYREALHLGRRHDEASLYTIFLPIDAGMLNEFERYSSLAYTEWGLERVVVDGGELCWTSNWVPYEWSVRELDFADTFHLALAYYQSGRADGGFKLLSGAARVSAYESLTPGAMTIAPHHPSRGLDWHRQGRATDFADTTGMFARAVVEGLFGVRFDVPEGTLRWTPQFPAEWPSAALRTPEFDISYRASAGEYTYHLRLTAPLRLAVSLPVFADGLRSVLIDNVAAPCRTRPGYGMTWLDLDLEATSAVEIVVLTRSPASAKAQEHGQVTGQLHAARTVMPTATARRLTLSHVNVNGLARWLPHFLEADLPLPTAWSAPAPDTVWQLLDLSSIVNGDVRNIFKEHYRSPRAKSCSAQLGTDGYSPWTYTFWKLAPPDVTFNAVPALLGEDGSLHTPQGVVFDWCEAAPGAALVSLWDNWPSEVTLGVDAEGSTLYALIAGTTNPMQTGVANAALHLTYDDGGEETFDLVHPTTYRAMTAVYDEITDKFALPAAPQQVTLGAACQAVLSAWSLRPGRVLRTVRLTCLSPEIIVGLLGLSVAARDCCSKP